jgi:hypothetical protein
VEVVTGLTTTVSSEVRMMETVPDPRLATYTLLPSDEEAMETGFVPTGMVFDTVLLLVLMTETVLEPVVRKRERGQRRDGSGGQYPGDERRQQPETQVRTDDETVLSRLLVGTASTAVEEQKWARPRQGAGIVRRCAEPDHAVPNSPRGTNGRYRRHRTTCRRDDDRLLVRWRTGKSHLVPQ